MKKLILVLSIIVLTSCSIVTNFTDKVLAKETFEVKAKSAFLCDSTTETVIYSKNEKERLPIASMTKIMLLILAFEKQSMGQLDFNSEITVSENSAHMGGSQVFIEANKEYKVGDLIKSIIIASANDASVAIAEHLFGSEADAVVAMNEKADKMGLSNTLFSNCTGLMKPTQYSCARDVAKMLSELIKYPLYFQYSNIFLDTLTHPGGRETTLTNTNKLVKFYNGCDGGKTGFTNEAGFCLAATAKRGSTRVISVLIKESDSKTRFKDCSLCFDYAFNNFANKAVLENGEKYDVKVKVKGGKEDYATITAKENFNVFGLKNKKEDIKIQLIERENIKAPIKVGDVLGKFIIYKDNVKAGEVDAISLNEIKKLSFFDYAEKIANA